MGWYAQETVRNVHARSWRTQVISLMLAGPSIHASHYPPPCSDLGFLDDDSQWPSCVIAAGILNYWPLGCPLISNTPRFGWILMAGVKRRRVGGREVADPQNYAIHWLGSRKGDRTLYREECNFFSRSCLDFLRWSRYFLDIKILRMASPKKR